MRMPATPNTDGSVIASTPLWSLHFIIRFIVISCGCTSFPYQMLLESHLEWTSVPGNYADTCIYSAPDLAHWGDVLAWQTFQLYLFLLCWVVEIRFPLSRAQGEFLIGKWSKYWLVDMGGLNTSAVKWIWIWWLEEPQYSPISFVDVDMPTAYCYIRDWMQSKYLSSICGSTGEFKDYRQWNSTTSSLKLYII